MEKGRRNVSIAVLLGLMLSAAWATRACTGSQGEDDKRFNGATVTLGSDVVDNEATIGPQGGSLSGQPGTPTEAVVVTVPPNTLLVGSEIAIGHNTGSIEPLDGTWGGLIIDVAVSGTPYFANPVEVTVPFSGDPNVIPVPYYVDERGELTAADLLEVDADAGVFTFETWHASDFTFIEALIANLLAESYNTRFRPAEHGFQIDNDEGVYTALGDCMGMTSFSLWYFLTKRQNLYHSYLYPVNDDTGQDVIASRAQLSISANVDHYKSLIVKQQEWLTPAGIDTIIRSSMKNTGKPIMLGLERELVGDPAGGHSVLTYGYVGNDYFLYDPNEPGQTTTLTFGGDRFQQYGAFKAVYFQGYGSLNVRESYQFIYRDAEDGFTSFDATLQDLNPAPHERASSEQIAANAFTLTGTVESGGVRIERVEIQAHGRPVERIGGDVGADGRFRIENIPLVQGWNSFSLYTLGYVGGGPRAIPSNYQGKRYELNAQVGLSYQFASYEMDVTAMVFEGDATEPTPQGVRLWAGYLGNGDDDQRPGTWTGDLFTIVWDYGEITRWTGTVEALFVPDSTSYTNWSIDSFELKDGNTIVYDIDGQTERQRTFLDFYSVDVPYGIDDGYIVSGAEVCDHITSIDYQFVSGSYRKWFTDIQCDANSYLELQFR